VDAVELEGELGAIDSARSHLNPGGTVIVNVGHIPGSDSLEKVVSATLHAVFPVVIRDRVKPVE
jgi:hypothetical protein